MTPALLLCFSVGLHMVPITFESPLCPIFWGVLALGALIQFIALKKGKSRASHWALAILLGCGLLACEVGCQAVTGWDRLLPMFLYFYLLAMLAGAGLCALAVWLRRRRAQAA